MTRHLRTLALTSIATLVLAGGALASDGTTLSPVTGTPAPEPSFIPAGTVARGIAIGPSGRGSFLLTCPEQGTGQCSTSGRISVGGTTVSRFRGAILEGGQTVRVHIIVRDPARVITLRRAKAIIQLTTMRGTGAIRSTQVTHLRMVAPPVLG